MELPRFLTALVPAGIKARVHQWRRDRIFAQALAEFRALGPEQAPSRDLLERLVVGWGNAGWSVQYEYMQSIVAHARRVRGPILECGPGLSSVLLGTLLAGSGVRIWSLEHHAGWAERVGGRLTRLGLDAVRIVHAPLADRGAYQWYGVPEGALPDGIALVLCDGPPSDTKGGRRGLLPEIVGRLAPDAIVLVDDMERADEQAMVADWIAQFGGESRVEGTDKPFAVYRVPGRG